MDLLTALLTCNLHTADPALVRAAIGNSHGNPYFVIDPAVEYTELDAPSEPKTQAEAVARIHDITSHGGKPLVGLMQLPPPWLALFGRALEDAFDPCLNIAIGSAMLSAFDAECAHAKASHPGRSKLSPRRQCAVRKYADALGEPDFSELVELELAAPAPLRAGSDPTDSPIFSSPPPRSWGPDCVLVPLSELAAPRPNDPAVTP
jgi:hypothetical protein